MLRRQYDDEALLHEREHVEILPWDRQPDKTQVDLVAPKGGELLDRVELAKNQVNAGPLVASHRNNSRQHEMFGCWNKADRQVRDFAFGRLLGLRHRAARARQRLPRGCSE